MRGLRSFFIYSFLTLFCGVLSAQDYEKAFQEALQEEAAKNWSAAIQNYLEARASDPSKSFPEDRIRNILQQQLIEGRSVNSLRLLLPPDLDQKFAAEGVYDLTAGSQKKTTLPISLFIYGFILLALAGGIYLLMKQVIRMKKQEVEEFTPKPQPKRKPVVPTEHRVAKPAMLTDAKREELHGMLDSVQSLTGELKRPENIDELTDDERQQLEDSGVVKALVETLLSEVQIETTEQGKYSKLSVDASLFFDEGDVEFFEKEFGSGHRARGE